MEFLPSYLEKEYKQFKGQLIETLTIIAITVTKGVMLPYSDKIIEGLLWI